MLDRLGPSPRAALLEGRHLENDWGAGFRYRFNTREDLRGWCDAIGQVLRRHGSIGQALAHHREAAGSLAGGLALLAAELRDAAAGRRPISRGLRFLLPDPNLGGACKRWWLYLRWMIQPAAPCDLGAWKTLLPASELMIPLDTHWIRIGPRLGLTARRTTGARMAADITEGLRRLDPSDPLRYDYAVCHLGISGGCPPRLRPEHCRSCPLRRICLTGGAMRL